MSRNQIQQMKSISDQQVLRTNPVPKKLGELIHLVNLLPQDLTTTMEVFTTLLDKGSSDPQDWVNEYKKSIEQLPIEVQDFIGPLRIDTLQDLDSRYSLLLGARDTFRRIARKKIGETLSLPVTQHLATLITDDKDRLLVKRTPLAEALEGIEATRIRECPVCGNIYWAGRVDQPSCSKKCGQTLRVRRWRKGYEEKYQLQRIRRADELELRNPTKQSKKSTKPQRRK